MKYIWCLLAAGATITWIYGLWTNNLDVVEKSLVSILLTVTMVGFVVDKLEKKN